MEIRESFFKGINRAISRDEFFDPDFFYTLQNARIFESGRIGEIVRIKGFDRISEELSNLDKLYDFVKVCNCVGISNAYAVFYKGNEAIVGGEYTYYIKVFRLDGTLVQSLSFTDEQNPEFGELKKYENTTFIAPFNKIMYGVDGLFYLRDFIPSTTKLDSITRDIEGTKALQEITFNQQLPEFAGKKSKAAISVLRNNIPEGVSTDLTISIGTETLPSITLDSTEEAESIAINIASLVNATGNAPSWTAEAVGNDVILTHINEGEQYNGIVITKTETGSSYVKSVQLFDDKVTIDAEGHWVVTGPPTETDEGITVSGPIEWVAAASPMLGFTESYGGSNSNQVIGAVSINLGDAIVSNPITLLSTDTTAQIATKIYNTLINDRFVAKNYNLSVLASTLTIESKEVGKRFNHDATVAINIRGGSEFDLPDNFYTVVRNLGTDAHSEGTLELNTNYWYTARIRYIDGYVTPTCSPKLINSKANSFIVLDFLIDSKDLNDEYPRIQIFRKKEDEPFYLINEISLENQTITNNVYTYIDDGKSKIEPLEEVSTVWTKEHQTQEIFENRLLKANIELFNEDYSVLPNTFTTFVSDADELDRDVAPYNSKCELFVKPRYSDGTQGFFSSIGEVKITQDEFGNFTNKKISVSQTSAISNTEKTIKELDFYGKYLPFGEEQNLKFNTIEIQTPNLAAIEDPQLFNTQTKIFFGYKYLRTNKTTKEVVTSIGDWALNEDKEYVYLGKYTENVAGRGGRGIKLLDDGRLEVATHGIVRYYVPIVERVDELNRTEIIYKLQEFEAIKSAISTGELYVRLNGINRPNLSRKVSDDVLLESKVRVVGIEDKTQTDDNFDILVGPPINLEERLKFLSIKRDNRLYLILEESDLDEIDKEDINKREVRKGTSSKRNSKGFNLNIPGSVAFDIINFQERERATSFNNLESDEIVTSEGRYKLLRTEEVTYGLINRELSAGEEVIYFGTKANDTNGVTFTTTGFVFKNQDYIVYSKLAPYNIYRKLITRKDFNFNRTEFSNQIIWSEDLIGNNFFNGGRSVKPFSFFNITKNNGKIIKLISLGKSLYVFCGIGVAKLLVGETLTQQRSGEVYVDSSKFITKSIWILENLNHIKKDSIQKINGSLLFTDGVNVYNITEQGISNISEGALNLKSSDEYIATIVPKYNEYRLSNKTTGETFVYNLNYKQWYGPHTYVPEKTIEINNELISYSNGLIKEEVGNTFNGVSYDTVIESVGNDTEFGSVDKTYRKFYIDIEGVSGTSFSYGKNYNDMVSEQFMGIYEKNGYFNVGIKNSEGNTKKIYWNITTTNPLFSLKGFNTGFILRKRR